jgi:hypothetical protein
MLCRNADEPQPEVTGMPLILFAICSVFAYSVFYGTQTFAL